MDFVKEKKVFEKTKFRFYNLFKQGINFEDNPFNDSFRYFMAFDFDFIFDESFFIGIKTFLKRKNLKTVVFYTIKPNPEDYFFHHFKKYSVIHVSYNTSDEDLDKIMMENPGDSQADALALNSNEISWFSECDDWAILGSREWEITIVGFADFEVKKQFIESFNADAQTMFTSVAEQAKILDEMLNFDIEGKVAYQSLVNNYKDRI